MGILASIYLGPSTGTTTTGTYAKVYIRLTDSDTGQAVNGNNIVVTYMVNENGNLSTYEATIPGLQLLLHPHELLYQYDDEGNLTYIKSYTIIGVSGMPNPSPPVNTCDLIINYITADRSESAPGAADGQFTVSATSSYLPLQYSLDNVAFQTSNVFTNLTGGLKTIYVKDANTLGCLVQGTVTIPTLSSVLIKEPSVTVGSNVSRWNAAFNPVVFTYQRKDFQVTNAIMNSIDGRLKIFVNTNTSAVVKGDMVYINTITYKGVYTVYESGANTLVIDTPYTSTATGFININKLRPYYKIITQINYTDVNGQQKSIQSSNRPDSTGLIRADIANFLQSLVQVKDDSNFTAANYRDSNLSASYQIQYAQQWDNPTPSTENPTITSDWVNIAHPYYVIYAAKQLGERYGGNLAAYVSFANGQPLAKWITDFTEPAYSNGYPFDIGFIYSEDILGLDIYLQLTLLDINRNLLPGSLQSSYLLNEDGSWLLSQDSDKHVIARPPAATEPLLRQLGLNRLLIDTNFPPEAYYFTIALKYNEGSTPRAITQTQTIRIDDAIDEQSIYLRWIGLSGSWNYYRFSYNQEVSLDVQNATIVKNYVSDWENQDSIEEVISKTAGQKMKVIAEDLSVADIKGLQSIKYSPKVQMLVSKDPIKWQTVVINTATFSEYETLNGQAPFSVTFNLPSINIQTQ
jgi:hypothetical protein